MVLSQRERYIAIGMGLIAGLAAIYFVIIGPMTDWNTSLNQRTEDIRKKSEDWKLLQAKQRKLDKVYAEMQKGGLKKDVSEAQSQMDRAVYDWAAASNVVIATASNQGNSTYDVKTGFTPVGYQVTCTGSTVGIATLLYQIETATIPIRIKMVQLRSRKDGVDDLMVELNLSTLCVAPAPAGQGPPANSVAASAAPF